MSYTSPIIVNFIDEMFETIQKDQETAIMKRVKMVVDIDEEELFKALRYDREQYDKGYSDGHIDGYENAKADFMRMVADMRGEE